MIVKKSIKSFLASNYIVTRTFVIIFLLLVIPYSAQPNKKQRSRPLNYEKFCWLVNVLKKNRKLKIYKRQVVRSDKLSTRNFLRLNQNTSKTF